MKGTLSFFLSSFFLPSPTTILKPTAPTFIHGDHSNHNINGCGSQEPLQAARAHAPPQSIRHAQGCALMCLRRKDLDEMDMDVVEQGHQMGLQGHKVN